MIIAKVQISGTSARTICCQEIPRGIAGAKVALEYDEELWSGLTKKVVFTNGLRTVRLVDPGESVELPPEVVDTVGKNVSIGVCGTDADGKLVVPTLWAVLSCVRNAVPVEADEAAEPTPPVWAQLLAMIGNTKDLKTQAKDNLVAAVNELVARGGEIDAAEVQRIVEEYLAANMPEVDLPEALPNPQPLTFTGAVEATYDGSVPVEVVIPQGVSEKELKHIAQIEITEDVGEIRITEDVDGNPFEVTDVYFFMKAIKRDSVSSLKVYINGGQLFQTNKFGATDRAVWPFISTVQIGDYRKTEMSVGFNLQYVMPVEPGIYNDGTTIANAVIKDISLIRMVAANGFKVGDTIDIWGI